MKHTFFKIFCFSVSLSLICGFMPVFSFPGAAVSPDIVISQVYGGGGNTGAIYTHDFVELFNRGTTAVSLAGWSVQYASATGTGNFGATSTQLTELPNVSLQPGQYYLVQEAAGAGNGVALPTPDLIDGSPIAMSATGGKVALVNQATTLGCNGSSTPCTPDQLAKIIDLVGYGGANFYEGSPTPTLSNSTAASRNNGGCNDTDNNLVDFTVAAPSARITSTPLNACSVEPLSPRINEFSASTTGTDVEYVEFFGTAATDYSAYKLLEIGGDVGTSVGTVDEVIALGTTDANGLILVNLPANALENGSLSLLLVKNFSGALADDLDTNDDGVFDATPWDAIVDSVAVNDGGAGDITYGTPALGVAYDGLSFAPGGASRIPDGFDTDAATDWVRNDFDLAGIPTYTGTLVLGEAYNTPGALNAVFVPPPEACGDPYTLISAVQGIGADSPLEGSVVAVEGIVVGDFQNNAAIDNGNLNGFHIQSFSTDVDSDPASSEGVFIYYPGGTVDVMPGDGVRVKGAISEYNGMTEITASQVWACSTGNVVTPTVVDLPADTLTEFEAYEGMLVTFPQPLVISEYFNFDRYNEIVLTSTRHMTPTAVYEPGSPEYYQAAQDFLLDKITLDDGRTAQNPDPALHPNGEIFDLDNLFRGGDTLTNVTGVIDYSFSLYRIQPTEGADYTAANPRPTAAPEVGGTLKVVSMNTLNYFTTLDLGPDICGPLGDQECRGADTAEEFTRQHNKLVAAIIAMDADVIGMIEIENNATDAPIDYLVGSLNAALGAGTYDYIHTGAIGTDAIRQALIYKPAAVTPYGTFAILDSSVDARFLDDYNRPVLAQSFVDTNGGIFTVAVNHLKSKGSACDGDPDLGDGAGNCNLTREAAAQALVDWLDSDPTGSGDMDVMIIGDLNSYDKEDPIDAILAGPDDTPGTFDDYVDMTFMFEGEYAYSYVFDGQIGYLDYAMTATLADQVTGSATWHVNADEPDLIDYDMSFKSNGQDALYAPDFYRYSDHDPVIIGLDLIPAYNFTGFYEPVKNAPDVTVIKAGSTVPVKFSLGGDWGMDIFEYGYPVLMKCKDCTFTEFEPDKLLYMDRSKLLYDASLDQYIFTWKTKKNWSGTCWILNILLNDGSIHQAYFKIK